MSAIRNKAAVAAGEVLEFLRAKEAITEADHFKYGNQVAGIIESVLVAQPRSETDHQKLITLWCAAYEEFYGGKYSFSAKDGKAVKTLLGLSMPPTEVVMLAQRAWRFRDSRRHFNCKFSVTLSGLAGRVNEIRSELGASSMNSLQVSPAGRERF